MESIHWIRYRKKTIHISLQLLRICLWRQSIRKSSCKLWKQMVDNMTIGSRTWYFNYMYGCITFSRISLSCSDDNFCHSDSTTLVYTAATNNRMISRTWKVRKITLIPGHEMWPKWHVMSIRGCILTQRSITSCGSSRMWVCSNNSSSSSSYSLPTDAACSGRPWRC